MSLSRFIVTFFITILVFVSCGTKPRSVISEEKMIEVFQDLYIVDAMMKNRRDEFKSDAYKDALINSVLQKHGITQAQLDSSLVWYSDNITFYSAIQDTVAARLQKRSDWMNDFNSKNLYSFKLVGFNTELPEYYILDANTPTFRFKIDSIQMRSFDKEKWELCFQTKGIDTTFHNIESSVYYKYADTIVVDKRKLLADSLFIFEKSLLGDSLLKEISGYVHMVMATDNMPKVMLSHIRNKKKEMLIASDSISRNSAEENNNTELESVVK